LTGIVRGEQAEVVCNECNTVLRTVAATELRHALNEMELAVELSSAVCAHCGAVHFRAGLSDLRAFTCLHCGQITKLSDDPMVELLFGS
jgi:RNase P subunit RPR2